jgi:hypothetical protein
MVNPGGAKACPGFFIFPLAVFYAVTQPPDARHKAQIHYVS